MRLSNAIRYLPFLALASASVIQPPLPNSTTLPKHYGVLLFDSFQIVDAFGPIELLASLAMLWPMNPMYLSILSATEHPVTSRVLNTPTMNHTHGFFGQEFVVTDTFANVLKNGGKAPVKVSETENKLLDIDVLIVPGGAGTRVDRTPEINFIREMYPKLQYIIGTCTGVTLMAKAGVLDGKEATSNKRAWSWVRFSHNSYHCIKLIKSLGYYHQRQGQLG